MALVDKLAELEQHNIETEKKIKQEIELSREFNGYVLFILGTIVGLLGNIIATALWNLSESTTVYHMALITASFAGIGLCLSVFRYLFKQYRKGTELLEASAELNKEISKDRKRLQKKSKLKQ